MVNPKHDDKKKYQKETVSEYTKIEEFSFKCRSF